MAQFYPPGHYSFSGCLLLDPLLNINALVQQPLILQTLGDAEAALTFLQKGDPLQ